MIGPTPIGPTPLGGRYSKEQHRIRQRIILGASAADAVSWLKSLDKLKQ